MVVKENQPTLYEELRLLFNQPPPPLNPVDMAAVTTVGHGRIETQRL